jgi:hypothetical protein
MSVFGRQEKGHVIKATDAQPIVEKLQELQKPADDTILGRLHVELATLAANREAKMRELSALGVALAELDLEIYWWKGHPDAEAHYKAAIARFKQG